MLFDDEIYLTNQPVRLNGGMFGSCVIPAGTAVRLIHQQEETLTCEVYGGPLDGVSFITSLPVLGEENNL